MFSERIHRYIYLAGLTILAISLPLSVFGMSISQLIILGNWLLEGNFRNKFSVFGKRKELWIFISIFIVHVLWLFPPQDYQYALNDLRIKVPLLVLPFLIATSKPLKPIQIKNILLLFSLAVFIGTCIGFVMFIKTAYATDYRDLSIFISHIRFSLMVVMAVFILLYYSFINKTLLSKKYEKIICTILIFWLMLFLVILKALTGIVVFAVIAYLLSLYYSYKIKHPVKWIIIGVILALPLLPIAYIYNVSRSFKTIENIESPKIGLKTINGNEYSVISDNNAIENGYRVWDYYCEKELHSEWPKRSALSLFGKDKKGNDLKHTLVRYLTSKGLNKDSLGMTGLLPSDIKAIEDGVPNYLFLNEWKIYPIIYNVLWELYEYKNGQSAEGHSITQRLEYLKIARGILKKHFILGVGTGNVQLSFNKEYDRTVSSLSQKSRLRAHNQYITFLITFGIFGFLWIVFAVFYPIIKLKGYKSFLFSIFITIALLSFINEDTLETQAGVTFFVFFYALLLFSKEKPVVQTEQ